MSKFEKCNKQFGKYGYLVARLLIGLMFATHGAQKLGLFGGPGLEGFAGAFGFPVAIAALVAVGELLCGLGIALGFYTRLGAAGGIVIMLGAWFIAHAPNGWNPLANGGELALAYLAAFLMLKLKGNGEYSLEKNLTGKEAF